MGLTPQQSKSLAEAIAAFSEKHKAILAQGPVETVAPGLASIKIFPIPVGNKKGCLVYKIDEGPGPNYTVSIIFAFSGSISGFRSIKSSDCQLLPLLDKKKVNECIDLLQSAKKCRSLPESECATFVKYIPHDLSICLLGFDDNDPAIALLKERGINEVGSTPEFLIRRGYLFPTDSNLETAITTAIEQDYLNNLPSLVSLVKHLPSYSFDLLDAVIDGLVDQNALTQALQVAEALVALKRNPFTLAKRGAVKCYQSKFVQSLDEMSEIAEIDFCYSRDLCRKIAHAIVVNNIKLGLILRSPDLNLSEKAKEDFSASLLAVAQQYTLENLAEHQSGQRSGTTVLENVLSGMTILSETSRSLAADVRLSLFLSQLGRSEEARSVLAKISDHEYMGPVFRFAVAVFSAEKKEESSTLLYEVANDVLQTNERLTFDCLEFLLTAHKDYQKGQDLLVKWIHKLNPQIEKDKRLFTFAIASLVGLIPRNDLTPPIREAITKFQSAS